MTVSCPLPHPPLSCFQPKLQVGAATACTEHAARPDIPTADCRPGLARISRAGARPSGAHDHRGALPECQQRSRRTMFGAGQGLARHHPGGTESGARHRWSTWRCPVPLSPARRQVPARQPGQIISPWCSVPPWGDRRSPWVLQGPCALTALQAARMSRPPASPLPLPTASPVAQATQAVVEAGRQI